MTWRGKRDTTLLVLNDFTTLTFTLAFTSIKLLYKRVNRFLLWYVMLSENRFWWRGEKPSFEWWGEAIFMLIFSTICVMFYHRLWHACCEWNTRLCKIYYEIVWNVSWWIVCQMWVGELYVKCELVNCMSISTLN